MSEKILDFAELVPYLNSRNPTDRLLGTHYAPKFLEENDLSLTMPMHADR
jgi:hypothetical protein